VIYSLDFERFTWLEDHDRAGYVREIRRGLEILEASGAGVVAMAANSPHAVLDELDGAGPELVDIVGSVGRAAQAAGVRRALLVGIPATMTGRFYRAGLARHGVEVRVPHPRHHERIRSIVFDELTHGVRSPASRDWLVELTTGHTVDALVLACTELSLLIGPEDAPIRVLDSTRLHVADILDAAYATNGGER
jgi:aspartate racemase